MKIVQTFLAGTPVSVVITTLNSETTILYTLRSLRKQRYPIHEIIVVDNVSTDQTLEKIRSFAKDNSKINIRIIVQKQNNGVGNSFNVGVAASTSKYVVLMHSDGLLPTGMELSKLVQPLLANTSVVATAAYILTPQSVWNKFNFWEKCLLVRSVDKEICGFNGKFNCVRRDIFLKIGGFDDTNYGHDIGIGGEDGDLVLRLSVVGKVVASEAKVVHIHYMHPDYSFNDWIINRKLLARSYGRFLRIQWSHVQRNAWIFSVKPILSISSIIVFIYPWYITILLAYAIFYMIRMYTTTSTILNIRILILPFITIFLLFYESFWMIESFLYFKKDTV